MFEQNAETQDMMLAGQGEIHLKVAVEKLQSRYGLTLATRAPRVPYRETIRKAATARGRHKRQSGGHGQFGDVVLEIAPAPRGAGFAFHDRIKGGVVPKQWIGSVEKGVREYMKTGPLGFPVVDVDGGADRRLLSHGGFLRRRLPDRGPPGDERRHARLRARCCWSRS